MTYMVMECHLSYAVVLGEDGRFLRVANRHYSIGQMVTDIIEMQGTENQDKPAKRVKPKWIYTMAAMAACLALMIMPALQLGQMPYASVYLTINPEVRIDVNRKDVVVGLEGMNADGLTLIEDYSYKKKNLDFVMDELVDKAIETGFLHEGGQITLTLDAEDDEWVVSKGEILSTHLNEYLGERLSVTIEVKDTASKKHEVIIPVDSDRVKPDSGYGESDYGMDTAAEEDAATSAAGSSGLGDSPYDDNRSDYGQTDYGEADDDAGRSDYGEADGDAGRSDYDEPDDDGQSNYSEPDEEAGQSDYDGPGQEAGQSDYDGPGQEAGQSNYGGPGQDAGQSDYDEPDGDDSHSDYDSEEEDD